VADDAEQLGQEDVEDEGQAVVDGVQVRAEAIQDPAQRRHVEEADLEKVMTQSKSGSSLYRCTLTLSPKWSIVNRLCTK